MSVTIRLARTGRRNLPAYKVVVANTKDKRNGKVIDTLGHYNPSMKPVQLDINKDKYNAWKEKGALETLAVKKLLDGSYVFVQYRKKGAKAEETTAGGTE
jgi:small subunit ribosomal protein S16